MPLQKILFAVLGIALIAFGGYRQFVAPSVNPADQARCETLVRDQSAGDEQALAELLPRCVDPGMVAMMDAQAAGDNAQAAAARIAAANQTDYSDHILDWALIGFSLVMLAFAAVGRRRA